VLRDVFTRYAADYDRWFDEHRTEYRQELARVRRMAGEAMAPALEIGAGSGRFAHPWATGSGWNRRDPWPGWQGSGGLTWSLEWQISSHSGMDRSGQC